MATQNHTEDKGVDAGKFSGLRGPNCFEGFRGQKAAISFTGGKDCHLAMQRAIDAGLRVECCAIFCPPGGEQTFQAHRIKWQHIQGRAMKIPVEVCTLKELETNPTDFKGAYAAAIDKLCADRGITVIVTGDIDYVGTSTSNFMQQVSREYSEICGGVRVLLPLWQQPRKELLNEMLLVHDFDIRFACVKSPHFDESWIGRRLDLETLGELEAKANQNEDSNADVSCPLDLTGENGEYHTMIVNGPMYKTSLSFHKAKATELLNQRGQKEGERWWVMDESSKLIASSRVAAGGVEDNPQTIKKKQWSSESYQHQSRDIWPGRGQVILAQFDEESVVLYQAFKPAIAKYACQHHKFEGCPHYNHVRMTWVKTNFLWMMFRCGWGRKPNQEHVLAIFVRREAFERYLEMARSKGSTRDRGTIRLQWDPDHFPNGDRHPYRRAIQLGMRDIDTFRSGQDILWIEDISEFVRSQRSLVTSKNGKKNVYDESLLVASERVYEPESQLARESVALSVSEDRKDGKDNED